MTHFLQLLLLLALAIATAKLAGSFASRIGQPSVFGEILVGLIARGEVALIVAAYGLSNGIIGTNVFSAVSRSARASFVPERFDGIEA